MIPHVTHQRGNAIQEFAYRTIDAITAAAQLRFLKERLEHYPDSSAHRQRRIVRRLIAHCETLIELHRPDREFNLPDCDPTLPPFPKPRSKHPHFEAGLIIEACAAAVPALVAEFDRDPQAWETRQAAASNLAHVSRHARQLYHNIYHNSSTYQARAEDSFWKFHADHEAFLSLHRLDSARNRAIREHHHHTPTVYSDTLAQQTYRYTDVESAEFEPEEFVILDARDHRDSLDPLYSDRTPAFVFLHRGVRCGQLCTDPYPPDYPGELAAPQLLALLEQLPAKPDAPGSLYRRVQAMYVASQLGIHNLDVWSIKALTEHMTIQGASHGEVNNAISAVAYGHPEIARLIGAWLGFSTAYTANPETVDAVIQSAKPNADPRDTYHLAYAMGANPRQMLHIRPSVNHTLRNSTMHRANNLDIPQDIIDRIDRSF